MLNVMTFNLKHNTPTEEVLAALMLAVPGKQVDVLCLQEVTLKWPPRHWRLLAYQAGHELGMSTAYALHPRIFKFWCEGVAVLSRYPIIARRRIKLSSTQAYSQVLIAAPEPLGAVQIGSVHISAVAPEMRHLEIAQLRATSRTHRAVLAGDFNETPSSHGIGMMLQDYEHDSATEPTAGLTSRPRKLDWIFGSPDLTLSNSYITDMGISDHRAVGVTVRVR